MNVYLNTDTVDSPLGTSGIEWSLMDTDTDYLILLTNGSPAVSDGQPLPTTTELNNAGKVVTPGFAQTCTQYFLADDSANELKQINLMGAGNNRYVMAFDFTEPETASEPVLEVWDDATFTSVNSITLGAGTPSSSWFYGITTTDANPGVAWSGSRLAGDTSTHYLELNAGNGALTAPKTLYCQLKIVIPSTETNGGNEQPVMVVKYTTVA